MQKWFVVLSVTVAISAALVSRLAAQGTAPERQLVTRAADALGGRDRVMAVKTLQIVGYGELAYFNGGGNITGDPARPPEVAEGARLHANDRSRARAHAGAAAAEDGFRLRLDGRAAGAQSDQRDAGRRYRLQHRRWIPRGSSSEGRRSRRPRAPRPRDSAAWNCSPIRSRSSVPRSMPATSWRTSAGRVTSRSSTSPCARATPLTLAVNGTSNLPAWVSYVGPNANLGDVTYRTAFTGYVPEKGIQLPTGLATTIDFRNVVQSKLYVDRNIVDATIDDLSAPEAVRSARPPQGGPAGGTAILQPMKVADHVWFLNGNTFFEFDDHITMVEANRTDAALQAILKAVNALVPGKRVTQVIQSHHHFDHSVGLRAAVAEGLAIISRRGNEGIFREMVARPARLFPDALGRNPKPLKFIPVDDHLKLKDSTNEIDIYHIAGNYHMADGVIVHVPASNLLVEADLTTQDWDYNWWGDSLMNNIEYRKIKVETNLAVHAQKPFPLARSRVGHRTAGSQRPGVLPSRRRGAVLPAWLPDSVQPAAAAGLELSAAL